MNFINVQYRGYERRRFPRDKRFFGVRYYLDKYEYIQEETLSENVSAGGICIIVTQPVLLQDEINLCFKLTEYNKYFFLKDKTIWKQEIPIYIDPTINYEYGIEFTQIMDEDRLLIGEAVIKSLLHMDPQGIMNFI